MQNSSSTPPKQGLTEDVPRINFADFVRIAPRIKGQRSRKERLALLSDSVLDKEILKEIDNGKLLLNLYARKNLSSKYRRELQDGCLLVAVANPPDLSMEALHKRDELIAICTNVLTSPYSAWACPAQLGDQPCQSCMVFILRPND